MNENGDRDTDFSLLDLEPVSGKYRVSIHKGSINTATYYSRTSMARWLVIHGYSELVLESL